MRPIQHPTNNAVFAAPPGATGIAALACTRQVYHHPWDERQDIPYTITYWQPTQEELYMLAEGKPVMLTVLGTSMPPVKIGVEGAE